jgi:hypothetical protein
MFKVIQGSLHLISKMKMSYFLLSCHSKQIYVNYSKQSMRFIASIWIWTKNNQANLWQTNKYELKIIKQIYDKQINMN